MEKRHKIIFTFAFLILLITVLYFFTDWFSKATGYIIGEDSDKELAQCLTEKNAKLYTINNCNSCDKQKNLFGNEAIKYLNYYECSDNIIECSRLESVPAWEINDKLYYGIKNLDELRLLSGCK
ncbi:MAG: hypothetical protein AABX83_00655 [Nanoarchaeota archaeon]